jgi:hypothetical protein
MAWDSSRSVPWQRLVREWLIYAAIMVAVFLLLFRGDNPVALIAGVLASGPLYLAFGYVLAKFGYQRKTLADLRTPRAQPSAQATSSLERPPPAPTRRTSRGPSNNPRSKKRR